jgi:hypothetical protein
MIDQSEEEKADAAAKAPAILVHQCSEVLDSNVAFELAIFSFFEGSKTIPSDI